MRPRIRVITTGGTIGERSAPTGSRRHLPAEDLLGAVPGLAGQLDVTAVDLFDVPSTYMTFEHMLALARAVESAFREGASGVVVTHGTDTLEETAFFLDLVVPHGRPVVVTGAMLPSELPGADGAMNLLHALLTAASDESGSQGVLVVMSAEIHAAREVTKAHSMALGAFKSLEHGPLGAVEEARVVFRRRLPPGPTVSVATLAAKVEGLKCYADMTDVPLRALVAAGYRGVVLEALGSGQVTPGLMPAIREATSAGVTVVVTSRCPTGGLLRDHYGLPIRVDGDERDLLEAGALFSHLRGPKARVALTVALGAGLTGDALRRVVAQE
jgi:L-asparaginase